MGAVGAERTLGALPWNWSDPRSRAQRSRPRARGGEGGDSEPGGGDLGGGTGQSGGAAEPGSLPAPGRVADRGKLGGSAAGPARAAAARAAGLRRGAVGLQCAPGSGRARPPHSATRPPGRGQIPPPEEAASRQKLCIFAAQPLQGVRRVGCLSRSESQLQTFGQFPEVSRV